MEKPCVSLALIARAALAETRFDTPVAQVAARCCQQEQDSSEGQSTQHMPPAAQQLYLVLRQKKLGV